MFAQQYNRKEEKNASDKKSSQPDMNNAPSGQSSGGPTGRKNKGVEQLKVTMPKGGGAVSGMGEKFDMNPVTGTGSFSVPLPVSRGRENMTPQLSAAYDSGSGNGILGIGWGVGIPSITIKTDKGLPKYDGDDVYLLSGIEDLVPYGDVVTVGDDEYQQYKPRTEGMFAKIERITSSGSVYWRVVSKDGLTSIYGESTSCRIADPDEQSHIFSWLLERTHDTKGNVIWYNYKAEDRVNVNTALPYEVNRTHTNAQKYIKSVFYGNSTPYAEGAALSVDDFMFRVLFDYGEHTATPPTPTEDITWPVRSDIFSSYRSGFDLRTYRRCSRACMFHKIDTAGWAIVKEVAFSYEDVSSVSRHLSRLTSMQMKGYRGTDSKAFPAIDFEYTDAAITRDGFTPVVKTPENRDNLPVGIDNNTYQWADLDGDGIGGILTQQTGAWHFKANTPVFDSENDVTTGFASLSTLSSIPSLRSENAPAFSDIDGDGRAELIVRQSSAKGFFKRNGDSWDEFTEFEKNPVIDWNDPTLKMIDLTGDGHPDILLTNGKLMRWYSSEGDVGHNKEDSVPVNTDSDHGPYIVFNDLSAPVFMADMTGDGLNDIVQITHNSVSYWPNLGYGRFGDKIVMDMGTTSFTDNQARFNGKYITLGDLDGSGTTDIVYSGSGSVEYWFNEAGNILTKGTVAIPLPDIDSHTNLSLIDLKVNGTLCLAWSSISPGQSADQLKFVDVIYSKPHLLKSIDNNMGKVINIFYAPSTKFYLEDKPSNPWITTLPFPVHVVEKVTTVDEVAQTTHIMQYRYHHGYYDGVEREFRGFGMVETIDTTDFENWDGDPDIDLDSYVEPTLTKTWFHTGNPLHDTTVAGQYQTEYFEGIDSTGDVLLDSNFADEYLGDELREAYRAMKGSMLRQEIYSLNKDDLTVLEKIYTVSEKSYEVKRIQTTGDNKHAIFFKYDRETLNYHYEEDPEASSFSPRISHEFTLELDDYGNVLQKASLVYPRSGSGLDTEQTTLKCTLEKNTFINSTSSPSSPSSFYRIGVPASAETFEIGGLTSTTPPSYLSFETIYDHINTSSTGALANILRYDESLSGTCARRIGWDRYYYWNEAQDAPLSNGSVTSKVLLHHAETAVTTPEQITSVFGTDITTTDRDDAGYILSDGYWWNKGLIQSYLGSSGFYLPQSTTDQWSNTTTVSWDTYFLAVDEITDPLGNTVAYDIDYITLNPEKQTGMNGEVTELLFDPLGMVTVVSRYGSENSVDKGDMPLSGYTEPSSPTVSAILADPATYVQDATSYFFYDLTVKPTVALSVHREIHHHDLETGQSTPYQMAIEYADGFGRLFQAKKHVEDGTAWIKSGSTWSEGPSTNRWLTSGRTVYNNKQQPVKQYEPFYTDGHELVEEEELVEFGVTPIIFYDPVGRVIRTDFPDGTYSKVEISPWEIINFDRNDTLTLSSSWYIAMSAGSSEEQDAATKAIAHADTPTTQHLDTLARPYKTEEMPDASTTLTTTMSYDISGNILSVTVTTQILIDFILFLRLYRFFGFSRALMWNWRGFWIFDESMGK